MDQHAKIKMGSSRSFGFVFAVVFAIVAAYPLLFGNPLRVWSACIAAVFAGFALFYPSALDPLNRIWFKFGLLIGKVISPIVMTLIYMLTVIPMGMLLRLLGKDPLDRRFDPDAPSYWKVRTEDEPANSMENQF